jgi:hypothetical protein
MRSMRGLNVSMNKPLSLCFCVLLGTMASCQKQESEAERKAEIDREVQQRLDAEHKAQEKQQLDQRAAELDAREKALAEKENPPSQSREGETARTRERTGRIEPLGSGPAQSYDMFYTKLDRYGDWMETPDYGYVFQPREAQSSRTWRPYTDGRWVYTDAGWTWISEEPFGWATYHYGRWTRLRGIGWVWVPGDEWAPAWVSWRKGSDYVGWAPLPPEAGFDRRTGIRNWADSYYDIGPENYCFVEAREFGAPRLEHAVVPPERNVTIINQTTNVTNITYNNTTVVNQGPNYDELRTRSAQPIERLRLERQVDINLNAGEPRPVVRGEAVVIPAPVIAHAEPVRRPPTVKQIISNAVIERGWEAIQDKQAAEQARTKMKSEATPPPNAPPKTVVKPIVQTSSPAETRAPISPAIGSRQRETTATQSPSLTESATIPPARTSSPMRTIETPATTITPAPTSSARAAQTPPPKHGRFPAETPASSPPRSAMTPSIPPWSRPATPGPTGATGNAEEDRQNPLPVRRPHGLASPPASPGQSASPKATPVLHDKLEPTSPARSTSSRSPAATSPTVSGTRKLNRAKKEENKERNREREENNRGRTSPVASPTATSAISPSR